MSPRKMFWFPALAILLIPVMSQAGTPEQAARDYLAAVKANRAAAVGQAMHPEALKKFQSALIPVLKEAERRGAGPEFLAMFGGVDKVSRLESMPPDKFFTAFYRSFGRLNPGLTKALNQSTFVVLGRVDEGATAHVLYRATFVLSDRKRTKLSVISFRKDHGAWKALLTDEYADLAAQLRRALPPKKE